MSVTRHYLAPPGSCPGERQWPDEASAPGDAHVRLVAVRVRNAKYEVVNKVDVRDKFFVEVEYKQFSPNLRATAILHFINEEAVRLFATNDFNNLQWWNTIRTTSKVRAVCHVPANFLAEGRIDVLAAVGSYNPNVVHALESDAVSFTVVDQSDGDGVLAVRTWATGREWCGRCLSGRFKPKTFSVRKRRAGISATCCSAVISPRRSLNPCHDTFKR